MFITLVPFRLSCGFILIFKTRSCGLRLDRVLGELPDSCAAYFGFVNLRDAFLKFQLSR